MVIAPGRVAPNETQYAYITPRAAGVVSSVTAHVGQDVRSGDLLATIDSPEVGNVRLELYTRHQALQMANAQAGWQQMIYRNTFELIERLEKGETPEQIHKAFAQRPVGENRERLITAYAQYRLAIATIERNRQLFAQNLITLKHYEQVNASYEVAQATYQSLMDQMGYETRLANTRAQQAKKQAETAVRVAQERLRILGVKPDGTELEIEAGKLVGHEHDETLLATEKGASSAAVKPQMILPLGRGEGERGTSRSSPPSAPTALWAPFDGIDPRPRDDRSRASPSTRPTGSSRWPIWRRSGSRPTSMKGDYRYARPQPEARGKIRFRSPAYRGLECSRARSLIPETSSKSRAGRSSSSPRRTTPVASSGRVCSSRSRSLAPDRATLALDSGVGDVDRREPKLCLREERPRLFHPPRGRRRDPAGRGGHHPRED